MNNLIRVILKNKLPAVFTAGDIKSLEPNDNVRYLQMKRAWQIKRTEIYC